MLHRTLRTKADRRVKVVLVSFQPFAQFCSYCEDSYLADAGIHIRQVESASTDGSADREPIAGYPVLVAVMDAVFSVGLATPSLMKMVNNVVELFPRGTPLRGWKTKRRIAAWTTEPIFTAGMK